LATGNEGEEGLEGRGEAGQGHRLGEGEGNDPEDETEGEACGDVAAELCHGDAGIGGADAKTDEVLGGKDRLGRRADGEDAGERRRRAKDEGAEDRGAEEADAQRRPPADWGGDDEEGLERRQVGCGFAGRRGERQAPDAG
jgi:hypothetical protein